jgi:phosphoglycerate dehydrogenase-like enzyme
MPAPRVAVGPDAPAYAVEAVGRGGGTVVDLGQPADALVWLAPNDPGGLRAELAAAPDVAWVQLPFAGVEGYAAAGVFGDGRTWTCAKGAYAEPVAEHALLLALAGLRHLPERVRARRWGAPAGLSLFDQPVTILGGGGITTVLLSLLAPFRVQATVVRRHVAPLPGAVRVVEPSRLDQALDGARVVFLALSLTPETTGIIGAPELATMGPQSWLVNVARGRHVRTEDLVEALAAGAIAGAALDVTDPEPLPEGHPLWDEPRCLITPHTADTPEMVQPLLARRIALNVARFAAGQPLEGLIDPALGY